MLFIDTFDIVWFVNIVVLKLFIQDYPYHLTFGIMLITKIIAATVPSFWSHVRRDVFKTIAVFFLGLVTPSVPC